MSSPEKELKDLTKTAGAGCLALWALWKLLKMVGFLLPPLILGSVLGVPGILIGVIISAAIFGRRQGDRRDIG